MKLRLLLGAIACIAILAGVTTSARADNPGGLTCTSGVQGGAATYSVAWQVTDYHLCSGQNTYSVELQYNTQAHQTTWTDVGRDYIRHGDGGSNYTISDLACPTSGVYHLRFKWWWNGGSLITNNLGAGAVCNNHTTLTTG